MGDDAACSILKGCAAPLCEEYGKLGHLVRDPGSSDSHLEFLSHEWRVGSSPVYLAPARTAFRLATALGVQTLPNDAAERISQFYWVMRNAEGFDAKAFVRDLLMARGDRPKAQDMTKKNGQKSGKRAAKAAVARPRAAEKPALTQAEARAGTVTSRWSDHISDVSWTAGDTDPKLGSVKLGPHTDSIPDMELWRSANKFECGGLTVRCVLPTGSLASGTVALYFISDPLEKRRPKTIDDARYTECHKVVALSSDMQEIVFHVPARMLQAPTNKGRYWTDHAENRSNSQTYVGVIGWVVDGVARVAMEAGAATTFNVCRIYCDYTFKYLERVRTSDMSVSYNAKQVLGLSAQSGQSLSGLLMAAMGADASSLSSTQKDELDAVRQHAKSVFPSKNWLGAFRDGVSQVSTLYQEAVSLGYTADNIIALGLEFFPTLNAKSTRGMRTPTPNSDPSWYSDANNYIHLHCSVLADNGVITMDGSAGVDCWVLERDQDYWKQVTRQQREAYTNGPTGIYKSEFFYLGSNPNAMGVYAGPDWDDNTQVIYAGAPAAPYQRVVGGYGIRPGDLIMLVLDFKSSVFGLLGLSTIETKIQNAASDIGTNHQRLLP